MDFVSVDRVASRLASVNEFFQRDVARFKQRLAELEAEIDPAAIPCPNDSFHLRVLEAFNESQAACRQFEMENADDPVVIRDVQDGFRRETAHWFNQSWIGNRARTKPNGFAGDYEMLIKLYDEATPARGLGGYLDLCILDLPLARAVRARMACIREFLIAELERRAGDVRILDIASGPCREYLNWPTRKASGAVQIVAMDNDPQALEFVDTKVANLLDSRTELRAVRYNALRTKSADATIRKFGRFDIIYSVGLYDYLTDEQLVAIFSGLRDTLAEGGVLYIAFKDTERYDKTPYQWHLDWFFYQRTMEDCLRLYEAAGFDTTSFEVSRDATGIIINFITRDSRSSYIRTDAAEGVVSPLAHTTPSVDPAQK